MYMYTYIYIVHIIMYMFYTRVAVITMSPAIDTQYGSEARYNAHV